MRKQNKQNGITLVALVITIIILIILAGISISALSESGLFARAQQAQKESENAQANEDATLAEYGQWMTNYIGGTSGGGKTITDTADTKPAQAMPANAEVIENDLSKGIVIKDSKDNEWVWVVVPKTTVFTTATKADETDKIKTDLIAYATDYRDSWTDEYYDGCGIADSGKYTEMYNKMLSSIYTNGGFWISRYEAGIKGSDTDTTKARTSHPEDVITDETISTVPEAVSQANMIPYNYVYCSEAQALAKKMSTDTSKTSSLLFGIQWDLTCKYLEGKDGLDIASIKSDSKSWGNYNNAIVTPIKTGAKQLISGTWTVSTADKSENSSILLTTGASDYTKKMNIYDFAGNEYEWTLEHATSFTDYPCAGRGGNYGNKGSYNPAALREISTTTSSSSYIGFRSTLY